MQKDQPEQAPEVDETVEQEVESPAEAEAGETTAQAEPEGELTQLLEDAKRRGLLEIHKDEKSGGYLISGFGPKA